MVNILLLESVDRSTYQQLLISYYYYLASFLYFNLFNRGV